jgi:UDP-N-acetylglucosamine transferase subunit ALG13
LNADFHSKRVLVAPLDWGLGHASRCIPIIRHFLSLGCEVSIAASGNQKNLLQEEFPGVVFLDLPGYSITYSKSKRRMPLKILIQVPKILKSIRFERRWLRNLLAKQQFHAVISDNRYGFQNRQTFSVFITHQLQVKSPFRFLEPLMRRISYRYINRFGECWVPDLEGNFNIAGELSHPVSLPSAPVKYIGPLSRFTKVGNTQTRYKWMVIVSGPEPQRSLFEEKVSQVARVMRDNFLIIRGMPDEKRPFMHLPNCTVFNHLTTQEMQEAILSSEFIISRCGYTTVMELLSLKKKSILIPTPGQTEQEYLANHLMKQGWCYSLKQRDDFAAHFEKAQSFDYDLPNINTELFKDTLADFISSLP